MVSLRDNAVRDLAWVIGSPALLDISHPAYQGQVVGDAWCNAQLLNGSVWLTALDLAPDELHKFIAARPTRRLGHYFETLLKFWLMHMPKTQIIATNLQVHDGQRTLGEYDFIFRDSSDLVCHWEVAVKFYLQQEVLPAQRSFIGPGMQDRLDLKMDSIFQHQLVLGSTHAGQLALAPGIKLDRTQAFIKGYLFYHAALFSAISIPGVSTFHLSGWWVRHGLEALPQISSDSRWTLQPRLRWLAPVYLSADAEVMTQAVLNKLLNTHFSLENEALLLFEMQRTVDGWREVSRGFVVCATWPQLAVPKMGDTANLIAS